MTHTMLTHRRPDWFNGGIVIAGNWSTLTAREQRIRASWTRMGYGLSEEEAEEAFCREMTPEMANELQRLGTTLVVLPLFSGMGSYEQERRGMEEIRRFAALAHERGLRVGVYLHQGMLSREFQEARPESRDWLAWPTPEGNFNDLPPSLMQTEGQPVYRNHPGYQAFMRTVIEYAVRTVRADFLHFDNYVYPSGWSLVAQEDFRAFLRSKYRVAEIESLFGDPALRDVASMAYSGASPALQEWQLFQGWMLAESYRKLAEHARRLNSEVAVDINASGVKFEGYRVPIDLPLSLPHGDAFWDEQADVGYSAQARILNTSIRSFKLARMFEQKAFTYTVGPLARAESLAFNNDCLGCLYWFLYGRINRAPSADAPADAGELPETCFYLQHRDLYDNGHLLADVAVFRGRDQNINGPREARVSTALFEQTLIVQHLPFTWITDDHLERLEEYRAVALADVRMMRDEHLARFRAYVEQGGTLIITGDTGSLDPWGRPRTEWRAVLGMAERSGRDADIRRIGKGCMIQVDLDAPPPVAVGTIPTNSGHIVKAILTGMGQPSVVVDAPEYVGTEFIRQQGRVIVHLVDYSQSHSGSPLRIRLSPALGRAAAARALSPAGGSGPLRVEPGPQGGEIGVSLLGVYTAVVINLA